MPYGAIKSFDMNTLQSNNPIEDAHAEATVKNGSGNSTEVIKGGILKNDAYCCLGMLLGIFDGHGGAACGQV